MNIPFADLHAQYLRIQSSVDAAIAGVIARSAFVRGPEVEAFEANWARAIGVKYCVSCANGTDALFVALRGLGVQAGDEVITTAHSWISTAATITQAGGRVVFCDTDDSTFTIDPDAIEASIGPRTTGIVPVHLYGHPADMDRIMQIAAAHGLWVLEDCAQAHLARYKGRAVGTFGNAATFSFYPGKNLGAFGDAGCIVTNDDALAGWMSMFARHGGKGEHLIEGINSRMDGLQAAVLNVKLPHLPAWNDERRALARLYDARLAAVGDVVTPTAATDVEHVYHLYVIRTDRRDDLRASLTRAGIATVLNYPRALPFYPAYSYLGHTASDFPVAHRNQSRILSLPMYPEMTEDTVARVADVVERFFSNRPAKDAETAQ